MRRSRLPTPKLVVSLVFEELDLNLLHHVRNLVAVLGLTTIWEMFIIIRAAMRKRKQILKK